MQHNIKAFLKKTRYYISKRERKREREREKHDTSIDKIDLEQAI